MNDAYDNIGLHYLGGAALILLLYAIKAVVLRNLRHDAAAFAAFFVAVACCVPVAWALSPDWNNRSVRQIANYVGTPIALMTVPSVSFLIDLARRSAGQQGRSRWRLPLELLLGVPAWLMFWLFLEFFVLGWVII